MSRKLIVIVVLSAAGGLTLLVAYAKTPGSRRASKNLFGNISYARARDGARVFFTTAGNQITILAKASKANEQAVINRLKKLY